MKNKKSKSIAFGLALKFTFLITVAILLLSVLFTISVDFLLRKEKADELITAENSLERYIAEKNNSLGNRTAGENRNINGVNNLNAADKENPEKRKTSRERKTPRNNMQIPYYITYVIFSSETNEVFRTNDPFLPLLKDTNGRAKKFYSKDYFLDGDLNILYYAKNVSETKYGNVTVLTSLNMDTDNSTKIIKRIPYILLIAFVPILLISFLVSLFITKKTLRPVVKMTESAKKISSSNLSETLPVSSSGDELDMLASTFNSLFEAIDLDFKRERQFTSDVSHELKTPVAVIAGQTNLLRRWGKDDKAQLEKSLDIIFEETKSMQAVIENLLQMSRLENGRMEVKHELISVHDFFERIKKETAALCPAVKINITDLDFNFYSDLELLRQVFMIVISNSIKFVKENLVLSLEAFAKNNTLEFKIKDNGQGFGKEVLPHVFERFYRGDESHTRKAGGAGLGLSIAKTIVLSLKGSITARDEDGAVILITLPV